MTHIASNPYPYPVTTRALSALPHVLGYIRVSTDRQADTGSGLSMQQGVLIDWCLTNGYQLGHIYEDAGSARGPHSFARRPGLMQAFREAEAAGLPVVVVSIDRLSRDAASLVRLLSDRKLTIMTVAENGIVSGDRLVGAAERAEASGDAIAKDTSETLQRMKSKGKKLGSPADNSVASQASVLARKRTKQAIIDDLAGLIAGEPELADKTAAEVVQVLNDRGIFSGWKRPWTVSGIRRPLRLAKEELAIRREIEAEPSEPGFPFGRGPFLTIDSVGFESEKELTPKSKFPSPSGWPVSRFEQLIADPDDDETEDLNRPLPPGYGRF